MLVAYQCKHGPSLERKEKKGNPQYPPYPCASLCGKTIKPESNEEYAKGPDQRVSRSRVADWTSGRARHFPMMPGGVSVRLPATRVDAAPTFMSAHATAEGSQCVRFKAARVRHYWKIREMVQVQGTSRSEAKAQLNSTTLAQNHNAHNRLTTPPTQEHTRQNGKEKKEERSHPTDLQSHGIHHI